MAARVSLEREAQRERRQHVLDDLGRLMHWTEHDEPGAAVLKVHAITEGALAQAVEEIFLFKDPLYKAHNRRFAELVTGVP